MNRKHIITTVMLLISLILMTKNNSYAASSACTGTGDYNNMAGINQLITENSGQELLGKTVVFNLDDMYASQYLYCVQANQASSHQDSKFRVTNYIHIEGKDATSYHFPNANSSNDAENDYTRIDVSNIRNHASAVIAQVLSGAYSEPRYRVGGTGDYTPTQKGMWPGYNNWLNQEDEISGYPARLVMGMDWNNGSDSVKDPEVGYAVLNQAIADVNNGAVAKVNIYILRCIESGNPDWKGATEFQQIMIAIPENTTQTITINKSDESTGVRLARTTFIIKDNAKNQYIQNIGEDGVITYTEDELSAYQFTTGISTYQSIVIPSLPAGFYTIKEIQNLNPGYDNEENIGKEVVINVTENAPLQVNITNYNDSGDDDDDDDDDDPENGSGRGKVAISGTVWEDLLSGKANSNNSKRDSNEKGIAGVKVYWKDSSGNNIANTTTDSSGHYQMIYNISVYNHTYSVNSSQYNRLNHSYIEFEYNGLKYTTVATSKSGSNTSKGTEVPNTRKTLDNYFDEVNGNGVLNNGQVKYRLSYNTSANKSTLNQSIDDFKVKANTKLTGINNLLDNALKETGRYCYHETRRWCSNHDRYHTRHYYRQEIDEWYIYNMNLGLVQREQPDIAITTDIEKVRVIMKGQEYTYVYNNRNISSDTNVTQYCVSFEKKYTPGVYTRPVNPSDIAYMQDKNDYDSNVQVYVTYVMRVKNQSNTLPVQIKEIVNYYDDDYEVTYDSAINWKPTSKYGETHSTNGYKSAYNTQLQDKTLAPGAISETLKIEYHVNQDTVKSLINKQNVLLRNVIEINGYRTLYGAETQCAENKKASAVSKTNTQYAGVDLDSAPGNATPGNAKTYEDDTDEAPNFKLTKNNDYRIISGTVWEDTQTTASKNNNERLGDGVKSGEKNVENVRVELYRITDEDEEVLAERNMIINGRAVTYPAITYTDSNGNYQFEGVVTDNYILKFIYGNNTETTYANGEKLAKATKINGNIINARNYKSTIITKEPVKSAIQGNNDDQWHLTLQNNASIAVDDLSERLRIPSLQYSNFNTPVNMVAYSAPFRMQVEVKDNKDSKAAEKHQSQVDENGGSFENNWPIFDFGIIERPREDIVIDKTIDNLKITLANGQILTEGNPYKDKMNYVKPLGDKDIATRKDALKAKSKLLYIEMDSELIQGSRLDIRYAITVTNNSEIDYEYDRALGGNEKYYYYGEVNSARIKPSVELVVDYVDTELTCTTENENNKNWLQVQAQELKDNGLISEATFDTIKPEAGNYLIFVTDIFKSLASGESHTEYLFATKLLANQAEDYTYENHAEILKLNGKIARNIDSTESTGKQVTKTYKPGTYIPSLTRIKASYSTASDVRNNGRILTNGTIETVGLHNQDDDMITIKITPPTGLENNITIYIITAVVALIIIAGGIYFIKKKVL